jgi:hypothetical protein
MTTILHHFICITGSIGALSLGQVNTTLGAVALLTELSTPFTNLRALMSYHKMQKTQSYKAVAFLFTFSFFLARPVLQSILGLRFVVGLKHLDQSSRSNFMRGYSHFTVFLFFLLLCLNFFWFSKIWAGF